MSNIEIIPAILPASLEESRLKLAIAKEFTHSVQIDIGDGKFSFSKTLQASDFSNSDFRGLEIEVHLMSYNTDALVDPWLHLGARRVILHAETQPHAQLLQYMKSRGVQVFIGITADSDIEILQPYLHLVTGVLMLSITPPGTQGKPFEDKILPRMQAFHNAHPAYIIEADGGISERTMESVVRAGATRLVMGSAIFDASRSPKDQFQFLHTQLERLQ